MIIFRFFPRVVVSISTVVEFSPNMLAATHWETVLSHALDLLSWVQEYTILYRHKDPPPYVFDSILLLWIEVLPVDLIGACTACKNGVAHNPDAKTWPSVRVELRERACKDIVRALKNDPNLSLEPQDLGRLLYDDATRRCLEDLLSLQVLLRAIKDPNHRSEQNFFQTYLDECLEKCRYVDDVDHYISWVTPIIKGLLQLGADVTQQDPSGLCALLRAAVNYDHWPEISHLLLEHGAKSTLRTTSMLRQIDVDGYQYLLNNGGRGVNALEWFTAVARCDITGADILQLFRDDYHQLLAHLSHGARGTLSEGGRDLIDLARDPQNVHTSQTTANLRKLVRGAKQISGAASGRGPPQSQSSPQGVVLTSAICLDLIEELSDGELGRLQNDTPNTAGRTLPEVRSALKTSAHRFFDDLSPVKYCGVHSGGDAINLVYGCLSAVLDPREGFACVCQGLLQAASEYGWGKPTCPQGSISMVLQQLEGRIEAPDQQNTAADQRVMEIPEDVAAYKQRLHTLAIEEPQMLHAEAVARLVRFDRKRLADIHDEGFLAGRAAWAKNELRGCLFDVLREEGEFDEDDRPAAGHAGTPVRSRWTF